MTFQGDAGSPTTGRSVDDGTPLPASTGPAIPTRIDEETEMSDPGRDEPAEAEREAHTYPAAPSQPHPEDPNDPALDQHTLGIDDTDTALATEDASNPAE
jgi:hypothetical protein